MDKINYEELIKDAKKQTNYKWKKLCSQFQNSSELKLESLNLIPKPRTRFLK